MIASNGVCKGCPSSESLELAVEGGSEEAAGLVKSVKDAEERRSVTAEVAAAGMLEAWCWEAA